MTAPRDLAGRLRGLALAAGAVDLAVADLTPPAIGAAITGQGGEWLGRFPRGLSVAYRLQDSLVDLLPAAHREAAVASIYRFHVYQAVNGTLDRIALDLAAALQREGYAALPVPASLTLDRERHLGHLSHKLVAHQAGLGGIGRSCLLLTPQAGPRVRLVTILTDARLVAVAGATHVAAGTDEAAGCGSCRACVDACPAGAITGRAFSPAEPRSARLDADACQAYLAARDAEHGSAVCGVCVAVCPYGD